MATNYLDLIAEGWDPAVAAEAVDVANGGGDRLHDDPAPADLDDPVVGAGELAELDDLDEPLP